MCRELAAGCRQLGIATKLSWSTDYTLAEGKAERLVEWVKQAGGTEYLSGPAARSYIHADQFAQAGIGLQWMHYQDYPEYRQLGAAPFEHGVSVLDLLFNTGPEAPSYMKMHTQDRKEIFAT